jgi:hypothetical protein
VDRAYDSLTSIRPCGPNKLAIRGATADVLRVTDVLSEEDITPLLSKTRELQPLGDDDGASTPPPCMYLCSFPSEPSHLASHIEGWPFYVVDVRLSVAL